MSRIIGIDLGTTNSCVALLDDGAQPRVLTTANGDRVTPSIVAFTPEGVLVGEPARRQAVTNAARTIFGAKRLIGRKVNSDEVTWFARSAPFRIVAAPNGDAWIRIDSDRLSPQEIAAHILVRMRQIGEQALGEPVTRAVVTVPAYFNDAQRQATRDAGAIAGLDIVRILNEPTAAALAYGAHRKKKGRHTIAVFDLGGGTFDISIMAVENGIFEVLSTHGDTALGGDDWDNLLIEHLADEIFDTHRIDITGIPVALSRLKEAAEQAKKTLTDAPETVIHLPYLATSNTGAEVHIERTIRRDEFEALTADLRERLAVPCQRALADARLTPAEIEEVLLVGGMTRSPAIQDTVRRLFEQEPSAVDNPEEVVALGAAAYGAVLAGDVDDAALLDVTPHDIGIKVGETSFAVIIERNAMLPVRARRMFTTTEDDQSFVHMELYEGDSDDLNHNRRLGHITLDGLPPGAAGDVRIELTITIDVESLITVTAIEQTTGKQARVRIQPTGGLSRKELVELIARRRARTHDGIVDPDGDGDGDQRAAENPASAESPGSDAAHDSEPGDGEDA